MSGGSYDYLCRVMDLGELLAKEHRLEEMADRLAGLGYAEDAAHETQELIVQLRQFKVRADVRVKRLSDLWHAVEWWDSGDTAEKDVRDALAKYRGEPTDPDNQVRITNGRDGTAFIWLPDVDYLDTQAGPVELGLDHQIAEQLRDALDGWLIRQDHPMQGCNTSIACAMRNGCHRCQPREDKS
ncbi:hypothetical protein KCMC57_64220 (plasmid) [Kitasatospora sp. CMC57]|uniref:Uncharacterized protein n=1 Tax=Kitasatospora sp. CMC57 TaxID=3231513 RepID=A0AB33K8Q6_9ACTN